jgi:hypothetical protein
MLPWLGLLVACGGPVDATAPAAPSPAVTAPLPADAVVLPASASRTILEQCSRQTPAPGDGSWQPAAADIAALETATAAALRARRDPDDPDWSRFPADWRRQYVGITRGGRRFIYGNAYPRDVDDHARDPDRWRHDPAIVCDGGPAFFGVEYDVEAGRITQLAFNGMA